MPQRWTLALGLGFALWAGTAWGGGPEAVRVSAAEDASKPFLVQIHADWCGTCQRLEPTLAALRERLGAEARFVILDVTDRAAVSRSSQEAERLGIRAFFDAHKARTGTVAVLHGATRDPVGVFKGELDQGPYLAAVTKAKGSATP